MSISKERWIATGDPRDGNEMYDDEGHWYADSSDVCAECDHAAWRHPKFECGEPGCRCMGFER